METEGKIISKLKKWFFNKFLPAYCKEKLTEENEQLREKVQKLAEENRELAAYISGMKKGLKAVKKIQIVNSRGE